jgi:hypothetical protein
VANEGEIDTSDDNGLWLILHGQCKGYCDDFDQLLHIFLTLKKWAHTFYILHFAILHLVDMSVKYCW